MKCPDRSNSMEKKAYFSSRSSLAGKLKQWKVTWPREQEAESNDHRCSPFFLLWMLSRTQTQGVMPQHFSMDLPTSRSLISVFPEAMLRGWPTVMTPQDEVTPHFVKWTIDINCHNVLLMSTHFLASLSSLNSISHVLILLPLYKIQVLPLYPILLSVTSIGMSKINF